jgi:hypothetical protein
MYRYDVFLSYSSFDNFFVRRLMSDLKKDDISFFDIAEQINLGNMIQHSIIGAIEESEYFVFLTSLDFLRHYNNERRDLNSLHISHVENEIEYALNIAKQSGLTIIPVVIMQKNEGSAVDLLYDHFPLLKEMQIIVGKYDSVSEKLIAEADQAFLYGAYEHAYNLYLRISDLVDGASKIKYLNNAARCCEECGRINEAKSLYEKSGNHVALSRISGSENSFKEDDESVKELMNALFGESPEVTTNVDSKLVLCGKIANYCNASIELFYELLKNSDSPQAINCLETSYLRLLNYCKAVGGLGAVISKLMKESEETIKELKNNCRQNCTEQDDPIIKSFRMYLGLDFPESDDYDVFISYKSEDEKYARRVYDFLLESGKKVFFACEVLPEMGKTEYRDAIMDALDHSQHLVLVASNINYITSNWVKEEWSFFVSKMIEDSHKGNLVLIETESADLRKNDLPPNIRYKQRLKMSDFRKQLLGYLQQ